MPEQAFWTPSEAEVEEASLTKFRQFVNDRHNLALRDYWELWRWSTGSPEEMNDFWTAVWDFTGVVGEKGRAPVSCQRIWFSWLLQWESVAHLVL